MTTDPEPTPSGTPVEPLDQHVIDCIALVRRLADWSRRCPLAVGMAPEDLARIMEEAERLFPEPWEAWRSRYLAEQAAKRQRGRRAGTSRKDARRGVG